MPEFNARIAHKILQQQMAGVLDAFTGRPKKVLKDMIRRGGKQRDSKTHYEAAFDNVVEGRKLRIAGRWLRARDRESKFRVVGYEVTDFLLTLVEDRTTAPAEPGAATARIAPVKQEFRTASKTDGTSESEGSQSERTRCIVCLGSYIGSECPTCAKHDRKMAKRLQRVEALFADGEPHGWDDILEAARGSGKPLDEMEEEELEGTIDDDGRFTRRRSGKWSFTPLEDEAANS